MDLINKTIGDILSSLSINSETTKPNKTSIPKEINNNSLDYSATSEFVPDASNLGGDLETSVEERTFVNNQPAAMAPGTSSGSNNPFFIPEQSGGSNFTEDMEQLVNMLSTEQSQSGGGNTNNLEEFDTVVSITETEQLENKLKKLLNIRGGAKKTSKKTTKKSSKKTSKKTTKKSSKKTSKKTTKKSSKKTSKKTTKKSSKKTSKKTTKKPSKKTSKKTAKKTSKKTSMKTSKKASKKTTKKPSKKASKKTSKKTVKKTSKKVSKKPSKKTVKTVKTVDGETMKGGAKKSSKKTGKREAPKFMKLQSELAKKIREREGLKSVSDVAKRVKAIVMEALGGKTHKELEMAYDVALEKALAHYK
ncbi:hypothetical protein crov312 [Cafeteria roenbergensis virus]|uniref:Uncharacterized protein n=1 Tax=Cafeteria roenbergensis virus (strain BV-PW1) TaxID=693272 RepID=E3T583_CROVB|nr:hypothetical protein crov312 [Cafeteria roenbergensis virus BV-PW1]ADO67346.1 hypothetical protein crov312 [Cafeteria roenbergensis virus BV-PW1]